jgi:uncharacterized protein YdaU (DUF1376 family)
MHYYKFEISVWNLHTAHLTLVEEAVYRRLIDHYYDTEQPIGLDFKGMIRRLRLDGYEDQVTTILNEFFTQNDDGWSNKHCDVKIKAYKNQKKANKNNGKAGGRPKKQKITESVTDGLPFVTLTTNNKQETKNKDIKDDRFDIFWKQYPRKVAKPNALKAWIKIKPDDVVLKKMLDAINQQGLPSKEIQFVPHPATWLNAKRWEDEVATASSSTNEWWMNDRRIK